MEQTNIILIQVKENLATRAQITIGQIIIAHQIGKAAKQLNLQNTSGEKHKILLIGPK